jgi:hypothetical protein
MILDHDKANGRVALSTKTLEPAPGDMLKSMETVFAQADATAARYHERLEAERQAREAAAKDIVAGLGGAMVRAHSRTCAVFCTTVCVELSTAVCTVDLTVIP